MHAVVVLGGCILISLHALKQRPYSGRYIPHHFDIDRDLGRSLLSGWAYYGFSLLLIVLLFFGIYVITRVSRSYGY